MIRSLPETAPNPHAAALFRIHRKQAETTTPFAELMTRGAAPAPPAAATSVAPATPTATTPAATAPATSAPPTTAAAAASSNPSGPSLAALFNGTITGSGSSQPAATQAGEVTTSQSPSITDPGFVPTLASMFGPNPWLTNPTGHDVYGNSFNFNPMYFATEQTAEKVAQLMGGTVVQQNDILTSGPIGQNQPNYMVKLASGTMINPGLVANFYTHGYPQSYIDRMLAAESGQGAMS